MAATSQNKILRIGVILGGKIIEEKLIRRREVVTVGSGGKNTLVLPSAGIPASFTLFEIRGNQYSLNFGEGMDGRVSLQDNTAVDLLALKNGGQAKLRAPGVHALPLPETARGKVQIGDATILFQFVTPPPEPQKPQLPAGAKGGFVGGLDRLFFGLVALLLTVNYTGTYFVWHREVDETVTLEEMPDRFVKMIMPEAPVEPPKEEEKPAEEVAAAEEKPKEQPGGNKTEEATPKGPVSREELVEKVSKAGILGMLGSEGAGEGLIEDVLGDGASAQNVADALEGASRLEAGTADNIGAASMKGGAAGEAATIGALGTAGVGSGVGLGTKKDVVVAKVDTLGGPDVESAAVDRNLVSREVRKRMRSIQNCYEKELKRSPTLKGKVVVRFVIGTNGRVVTVEIEEDSLRNSSVTACMRTTIRSWSFPVKLEDEVGVSFPFVFSPAS